MVKIMILDKLSQEGLDMLDAAPGVTYEVRTGLKGEDLRAALADADGAICRSGVKITADVLEGNRRLRAIARAGVGTDNIDKVAATRLGILVMNTPTGNTLSTAEHAFALMLALSRNIAPAYQSLIEGRWDRSAYTGTQLADKTLGVVGMGRIGQEVASRAIAFGMRVIGYDPFLSAERAAALGIEPVATVDDMLGRVDYLTVHTPLTPETKNLIDIPQLDKLKPGVRLINCARGGIYNEAALVEGLKSGKIAGVALDVFEQEPCTSHPLFGMPGVLCTPHLGASTEEAQTQVAIEAVQLLLNYFSSGEIRHAVNMASVDPKTLAAMRGDLDVAHRLGRFLAQWSEGQIRSCRLSYRGEAAAKDTNLLTSAFCAGLVEAAMDEAVNIVNARVLLQDRGIEVVTESRAERGAFNSAILADVTTASGTFQAGGTLFGHDMPRMILLENFRLEAYLDGCLLVFVHQDVPGIIGAVGSIFGKHDVNIAQMAVGRLSPGSEAIGILNLDGVPADAAIAEVSAHPHIRRVSVVTLPPAGKLPDWLQG
ncbi:MAG: phosphoglycerate dehydrogenase [Planctomycetales bacterium]|nr:phosphoglycerate dehydrogenase [Planctomycetales bacterium]